MERDRIRLYRRQQDEVMSFGELQHLDWEHQDQFMKYIYLNVAGSKFVSELIMISDSSSVSGSVSKQGK